MNHTPTPWHLDEEEDYFWIRANTVPVAEVIGGNKEQAKADAAIIVRAVNSHEELLDACKAQHNAIDILMAMLIQRDHAFMPSGSGFPWAALKQGNKAIAKAEGK